LDWYLSSVQLSDESLLIELLFQYKALFIVDGSHFPIKPSLILIAIIVVLDYRHSYTAELYKAFGIVALIDHIFSKYLLVVTPFTVHIRMDCAFAIIQL